MLIKQLSEVIDVGKYQIKILRKQHNALYIIIKQLHTKGNVSSVLATKHVLPDPTAPSPYPRTLPRTPIAND